ncbi:hypothetical protein Dda_1779 [Drechslerella dactyloides]|uniref:Uncharacterized protein n=1 Tax=Drechslerella dactyloides TaxID=74499 RepID=A0AAD6J2B0_DREDA|nr:hypothetical protein Dda_1779 [Drechslerella dactyloides]
MSFLFHSSSENSRPSNSRRRSRNETRGGTRHMESHVNSRDSPTATRESFIAPTPANGRFENVDKKDFERYQALNLPANEVYRSPSTERSENSSVQEVPLGQEHEAIRPGRSPSTTYVHQSPKPTATAKSSRGIAGWFKETFTSTSPSTRATSVKPSHYGPPTGPPSSIQSRQATLTIQEPPLYSQRSTFHIQEFKKVMEEGNYDAADEHADVLGRLVVSKYGEGVTPGAPDPTYQCWLLAKAQTLVYSNTSQQALEILESHESIIEDPRWLFETMLEFYITLSVAMACNNRLDLAKHKAEEVLRLTLNTSELGQTNWSDETRRCVSLAYYLIAEILAMDNKAAEAKFYQAQIADYANMIAGYLYGWVDVCLSRATRPEPTEEYKPPAPDRAYRNGRRAYV